VRRCPHRVQKTLPSFCCSAPSPAAAVARARTALLLGGGLLVIMIGFLILQSIANATDGASHRASTTILTSSRRDPAGRADQLCPGCNRGRQYQLITQ
jgi:hypothetical protein